MRKKQLKNHSKIGKRIEKITRGFGGQNTLGKRAISMQSNVKSLRDLCGQRWLVCPRANFTRNALFDWVVVT